MTSQDVNDILMDYKLSMDILGALGFLVANKDRCIGLYGADFYVSCENAFRNVHLD